MDGTKTCRIRERRTYLGHQHVGLLSEVSRREAQQGVARVDELVLPPIVRDQSIAVVTAIELHHQTCLWVIEVRSGDEPADGVAKVGLDLGPWQPRRVQQPPEAGLHWRFSRLCQLGPTSHQA